METIRTYLDNLFAGLPQDERLSTAKAELLSTMEDKYNSLKAEGKSENESIGIVISEFGNIDELLEELGISRVQADDAPAASAAEKDPSNHLSEEEVNRYLRVRRSSGWMVGAGVFMCLLGPAALISLKTVLNPLGEAIGNTVSLISLLVCIAVGIILFVVSSMKSDQYDIYEHSMITLPDELIRRLTAEHDSRKARLGFGIGSGVALILVGVCIVMAVGNLLSGNELAEALSVSSMLVCIGLGVMLICRSGIVSDSYKALLNLDKKIIDSSGDNKEGRAETIFSAVLWACVLVGFFIWSFVFNGWSISWIVFPIAGIINSSVKSILRAVRN